MRYFLIDRVNKIEIGRRIKAIKNVSLSEDIFADHFIGSPVMPGALLIESLAQAGTVLLEYPHGLRKKAILAMVERAKFRSVVRPGDQLRIEVTLDRDEGEIVRTKGTIEGENGLVVDAALVFHLADAEEFYPPKTRHIVEIAYDSLLAGTEIVTIDDHGGQNG